MSETIKSKELQDSLSKCRCCLRLLIDDRKSIEIDDKIREQFFNLCSISLITVDILANKICQLCANDLESFSNLRADLVEKQNALYAMAGLLEIDSVTLVMEEDMHINNQVECKEEEKLYEIVDQQYEETDDILIEDEGGSVIEEIREIDEDDDDDDATYYLEDDESVNSLVKIEKVEEITEKKSKKRTRDELELAEENQYYDVYEDTSIGDENVLDGEQIECEICGIPVLQEFFDHHVKLMHVENLKCDKCEESFDSKILLKKHDIEYHNQQNSKMGNKAKRRRFFCGLCDKEYEYKKYLIDHIRSFHKKERNKQCPVCYRHFYHRDIKKHISHVHGEKKISCNICGKLYTCIENLKLHLRYHSEPKFICQFENCGRKFHQKILYENHLLKHSPEKNIQCNTCKQSFYTHRDLKRHIRRVHERIKRKCFGCDSSFYRKDKYREHVIKHHKELSNEERESILSNIREIRWNDNL